MRPQLTRGVSMPLTPADVHNVAFKKPPIGKRGYDEE
jgi:DivIVA domain-containing protein